jgi:hypothetical protein
MESGGKHGWIWKYTMQLLANTWWRIQVALNSVKSFDKSGKALIKIEI